MGSHNGSTFDSWIILVDEVTLDELNCQRRLSDTCSGGQLEIFQKEA